MNMCSITYFWLEIFLIILNTIAPEKTLQRTESSLDDRQLKGFFL